ncbi:MAG: protein-L-isoaspartate O-methyltransferase [Neptuniibacter caesariensis]|uniref:Protein-L-isoaspartate O-methyltransferase n=1 Tax=Neptuniibacter caesariensis TaxID=207954 RepID=A0A2G6JNI3_NEPCE|nr:MAG: protein-L-isoaspartate O-methyltransferase [Neptuniibacter caesariensis]
MTSQRTRDRLINRLREQGIKDEKVLEVMRRTPRHIFIDEALAHRAYEDTALPIGYNQTISQPFIVARMTEVLLDGGPLDKVLEVGTGSGYQTSILAPLVGELYSVERIKPLQDRAKERLKILGLKNVQLKHTDGGMGWQAKAPYDAILAACAPEEVPEELKQQLVVGGRLIIPVGGSDKQELKLVVRETEDEFSTQVLEGVKFVPLLSGTVR